MVIFAAIQGYTDEVAVADVPRFEGELRNFLNQQHPQIGADIASTKALTPENEASLRAAITAFKEAWFADRGES